MFITSFTTAGAFLSNAVSSVIPVCLFGLFMCLLVVVRTHKQSHHNVIPGSISERLVVAGELPGSDRTC